MHTCVHTVHLGVWVPSSSGTHEFMVRRCYSSPHVLNKLLPSVGIREQYSRVLNPLQRGDRRGVLERGQRVGVYMYGPPGSGPRPVGTPLPQPSSSASSIPKRPSHQALTLALSAGRGTNTTRRSTKTCHAFRRLCAHIGLLQPPLRGCAFAGRGTVA